METFYCAQRGCVFEAEDEPADCVVCGNPFIPHPDPDPHPDPGALFGFPGALFGFSGAQPPKDKKE